MNQKTQIPISPQQKNLLQQITNDIIDMDVTRVITTIVSKEGKNYIYLDEPGEK